jgi:hypothetical protein
LFSAPRTNLPFEAQMTTERPASALGSETLDIVGKLGGDIRFPFEPPGMRFRVRLQRMPAYGRTP